MRRVALVLVPAALWFCGCPDKDKAEPARPAEVVDAGVPPRPASLEIAITGEVPDAGVVDLRLGEGERTVIPPIQSLELVGNLPLENYRVRVFDEADRAMVSDDSAEDLDGGFRYRIQFPEPLKTGHRYALVVDAETGSQLRDAWGREHPDYRRDVQIEGEKQKPPPPERKSKRRRR
ncbi:MAG: hypothetical protein WBV82_25555 [Myxococcaceae bacterium]